MSAKSAKPAKPAKSAKSAKSAKFENNRISLITQPKYLSNTLCDILGVPYGTRMQKFKVVSNLVDYCLSHNLIVGNSIIINRVLSPLLTVEELGGVFNSKAISFAAFREVITRHMHSAPLENTREIVIHSLEELVEQLYDDEKYHLLSLLVNNLQYTEYANL